MSFIKSILPTGLKRSIKTLIGVQQLQDQQEAILRKLETITTRLYESHDEISADSKSRWKSSNPDEGLTWNMPLKGDEFVKVVSKYNPFGDSKAILEIGPGYGRLLKAILEQSKVFKNYLGLDISPNQVKYLTEKFGTDRIKFQTGDAEKAVLEGKFDMLISSLVFKHIYPSCDKALHNLSGYMNPQGKLFIDFIEGKKCFFEDDGVTYIRHYTREELQALMEKNGFKMITFDEVLHTKGWSRLLVVAEKV